MIGCSDNGPPIAELEQAINGTILPYKWEVSNVNVEAKEDIGTDVHPAYEYRFSVSAVNSEPLVSLSSSSLEFETPNIILIQDRKDTGSIEGTAFGFATATLLGETWSFEVLLESDLAIEENEFDIRDWDYLEDVLDGSDQIFPIDVGSSDYSSMVSTYEEGTELIQEQLDNSLGRILDNLQLGGRLGGRNWSGGRTWFGTYNISSSGRDRINVEIYVPNVLGGYIFSCRSTVGFSKVESNTAVFARQMGSEIAFNLRTIASIEGRLELPSCLYSPLEGVYTFVAKEDWEGGVSARANKISGGNRTPRSLTFKQMVVPSHHLPSMRSDIP